MRNKIAIFFSILFLMSTSAFARAPFLDVGHREAMMAGGGAANSCSPGQFMLNPAGLVCGNKDDLSESFGSTNFSTSRVQINQVGNLNDLDGAQAQTRPGLSIFSQSSHDGNSVFGAWGSINQFSLDKAALISGAVPGSVEFLQSTSEWNFGGLYAKKFESFSWGSTFSFGQKEYRNLQNAKYRMGTDYFMQYDDSIAVEKFLAAQLGVLVQRGSMTYALAIRPPRYSLGGKVIRNISEAGTSNHFSEKNQSASVRSSEPWMLSAGSEYSFSEVSHLAVDLGWMSASRSDFGDLRGGQEDAPSWSLILSSKIQISPKTTFISGFRWLQSVQELTSQSKYQNPLLSLGILRTFRGVELGTALAYSRGEGEDFNQETQQWQKGISVERLDFTFSSSFTY